MLRTLALIGVAAVAYNQLKKNGSLDRFTDDIKRRADDLRAYVDEQRAHRAASTKPNSTAASGTAAI